MELTYSELAIHVFVLISINMNVLLPKKPGAVQSGIFNEWIKSKNDTRVLLEDLSECLYAGCARSQPIIIINRTVIYKV